MIRFSAFLVVVAVGLLVAGVVTSKLLLVYLAIGVSGVALLALGIGAAVNWRELFAKPKTAASDVGAPEPVPAQDASFQAPQAQPGLATYSRPSAAGPVWEPAADSLWEPATARPATAQAAAAPSAAANAAGRNRPANPAASGATAAVLWESAVPPTGTFPRVEPAAPRVESAAPRVEPAAPRVEPAAQASGARSAEPPAPAGSPRSSGPVVPPVPRPAAFQRPSPAFTPRSAVGSESAAPSVWKRRDDSVPSQPLESAQPGAASQPDTPVQSAHAEESQPANDPGPAAAQATHQAAQRTAEPGSADPEAAVIAPSLAAPRPPATLSDPGSTAAGSPPAAEGVQTSATREIAPNPPEPESADASPAIAPDSSPPDSTPAASVETSPPVPVPDPVPDPGPDPKTVITVVPGVPRYHNASCLLIRFMGEDDLEKMTLAAAREAGCTPCRACLPDQPGRAPE